MRNGRIAAFAILALSIPVSAWSAAAAADKVDLTTWDPSLLHRGWRASTFFGTKVYGKGGDQIGEVENFYVDMDGRVTKVIVESGGILDVGDVHLAVPWDQVKMWPGEDGLLVPVNNDNVPEFSLFRDDPHPGVAVWRVTDLIGDLVYLADGDQYGMVEDMIISLDGKVEAIVVSPDVSFPDRERKAYPWYGQGYDPMEDRYELPYDLRDIELLGPFDDETTGN